MKSGDRLRLSLVIPAYNEEATIVDTLRAYRDALAKEGTIGDFEMIVVSNNCRDQTPALCAELAKSDRKIRHLDFAFYTGKGGAVLEGFKAAKFEWVGFVDADNSTAPSEFVKLLPFTQDPHVGCVIASRKMPDSVLDPPQPVFRRILGASFTLMREIFFDLGIRDSQCGAKIFRRALLQPFNLVDKKFGFDVELLFLVKSRGYRIVEKGIVWRDSRASSVRWYTPLEMFVSLFRVRGHYFTHPHSLAKPEKI